VQGCINRKSIAVASDKLNAYSSLIAATEAVIDSAERIDRAREDHRIMRRSGALHDPQVGDQLFTATRKIKTEMDTFANVTGKFFKSREWATSLGLFDGVDFSAVDAHDTRDTRDIRNMREHEPEYLQGKGHAQARWFTDGPVKIDGSSSFGSEIGGRLDYTKFADTAKALLPELKKRPHPQN
jgi:hypothetical protein